MAPDVLPCGRRAVDDVKGELVDAADRAVEEVHVVEVDVVPALRHGGGELVDDGHPAAGVARARRDEDQPYRV